MQVQIMMNLMTYWNVQVERSLGWVGFKYHLVLKKFQKSRVNASYFSTFVNDCIGRATIGPYADPYTFSLGGET